MKIAIVTPSANTRRTGNRHTAARWARWLRELGHRVQVQTEWKGAPADLMLALHARKSHDAIGRFRAAFPEKPLVVALTGTDLYRDIAHDATAQESLRLADRLIVLQELGGEMLAPELRDKVRVVYQSAPGVHPLPQVRRWFRVCVSGHLREEKDPFRCAEAAGLLPAQSRIRIVHIGGALTPAYADEARAWMRREPRYRWLGEVTPGEAARRLAHSRLMVISSRMEGGANVVCEAFAARVPVLASRVPGNVGMLGANYEGYFPVGDTAELARLLWRAESEPPFLKDLTDCCARRAALTRPEAEKAALAALVAELS